MIGAELSPIGEGVDAYLGEDDEEVLAMIPWQAEFVADTCHRYIGVIAGLGAGKTRGAVYWCIALGISNPGCAGAFCEPTYNMVEDIAIPMFEEVFDEWGLEEGVDYEVKRRPPQSMTVRLDDVQFKILFRSTENPRRLVGLNLAWVLMDEADDHEEEAAKILATRIRAPKAKRKQMGFVGTPENLGGWVQQWLEIDPLKGPNGEPYTRLIRAKTTDNPFLDEDYVEVNLGHLSPLERKMYVDGEWIARGGRVYTCYLFGPTAEIQGFTHEKRCDRPAMGQQTMACDFGQGCMAWFMGRVTGDVLHFHGEQVLERVNSVTAAPMAAQWWQTFFREQTGEHLSTYEAASRVNVYCDPAGSDFFGKTDVALLRKEGFKVFHRTEHPDIPDRVNSVEVKLHRREMFIDPRCQYLVSCFREHDYDLKTGKPRKAKPRDGKKGRDHGCDAAGYQVEFLWRAAALRGNAYHYN